MARWCAIPNWEASAYSNTNYLSTPGKSNQDVIRAFTTASTFLITTSSSLKPTSSTYLAAAESLRSQSHSIKADHAFRIEELKTKNSPPQTAPLLSPPLTGSNQHVKHYKATIDAIEALNALRVAQMEATLPSAHSSPSVSTTYTSGAMQAFSDARLAAIKTKNEMRV